MPRSVSMNARCPFMETDDESITLKWRRHVRIACQHTRPRKPFASLWPRSRLEPSLFFFGMTKVRLS